MTMSDKLPPFANPEQAQKDIRALGACGELLPSGYFCIQTDDHEHYENDPLELMNPTRLCLHRHRLPSREIPCAECVGAFMKEGHWGGCSSESDYPCDCPYRDQEAGNGAKTASGGGAPGAP